MYSTTSFDSLTTDALRSNGSKKWTLYGTDVIGAFVAEMDFGTAPEVVAALHAASDGMNFGYLPGGLVAEMAEACAAWQRERYGWTVDPARIHPLPDVIRGLEAAIDDFSVPGSPVILPTPAYMPFFVIPGLSGRDIIQVPMVPGDDGRPQFDLDGLGRAFEAGGNLMILTNPHNPVGRVFDASELRAVAGVVEAHGGRVFSDEIHAPLVYSPGRHTPYASVSPAASAHSVTATSASKAWNLPGLKCAQLILTGDADEERWRDVGFWPEHGASNIGVIANTAAYRAGRPWLEEITEYLDGNRKLLADLVAELLPGAVYTPPEGTYMAWIDCSRLGLGPSPAEVFLDRARVALVDGARAGAPGYVRLTFATPRPVLTEMVERMSRVLPA